MHTCSLVVLIVSNFGIDPGGFNLDTRVSVASFNFQFQTQATVDVDEPTLVIPFSIDSSVIHYSISTWIRQVFFPREDEAHH